MVLQAVAATSGTSKARIVFDPAELTPEDYLVLLSFRASTGRSVRMPPVMQDCLRDLVLVGRCPPSLPLLLSGPFFRDRAHTSLINCASHWNAICFSPCTLVPSECAQIQLPRLDHSRVNG